MTANSQFALTQCTPHSYHTRNQAAIAQWLMQQGFIDLRTSNDYELARLRRSHEIVIVYRSGSVVCQGAAADDAMHRLALLVQEQVEHWHGLDLWGA